MTYTQIRNDNYIVSLYNNIEKGNNDEKLWANHSWGHIDSVIRIVEKMLSLLKYDEKTIERAKVAALLHDIGCIKGKNDHAIRSYEMAKQYLESKLIDEESIELIVNAIKNHSDGIETKNIIDATLFFADKLDYTKNRLTEEGHKIEGFKEIQYIDDIDIMLENNTLIVNFIASDLFNKEALEKFYFTPKIFNAVHKMSDYINVKGIVKLNGQDWVLPQQKTYSK